MYGTASYFKLTKTLDWQLSFSIALNEKYCIINKDNGGNSWGCSSVVEHMFSMSEVLALIANTRKRNLIIVCDFDCSSSYIRKSTKRQVKLL